LQKDEERKEQKNSLIRNYYSGRVFGFGQHLDKRKHLVELNSHQSRGQKRIKSLKPNRNKIIHHTF
jgi:hypothetical protein